LGLLAVCYFTVDLLSDRTPITVFLHYATFSPHTAYWRLIIFEHGMNNVFANPIFGLGLNDWERPAWMHSGSMDNFWLVVALRYGIPGFLFLTVGYAVAVFRAMFRDFSSNDFLANLRMAWVFVFLGLSFTLSTVHVWTNVYSFIFFVLGAGMWLLSEEVKPGEREDSVVTPKVDEVGGEERDNGKSGERQFSFSRESENRKIEAMKGRARSTSPFSRFEGNRD
jgi:O-antigen ligase